MAYLLNVVTNATSSFLELHKVSIDNWVFKLYYKFTTSLLLVSSILTTSKQLFGSPIQCDSGAVQINPSNIDQILQENDLVMINFYADWCR